LLAERGLWVDHVIVWRWVQRYAPELQRRLRRHLKPTSDSWRVDETYIRITGKWRYLYRAVGSTGATLDFLPILFLLERSQECQQRVVGFKPRCGLACSSHFL
jgi:hypothetical protein